MLVEKGKKLAVCADSSMHMQFHSDAGQAAEPSTPVCRYTDTSRHVSSRPSFSYLHLQTGQVPLSVDPCSLRGSVLHGHGWLHISRPSRPLLCSFEQVTCGCRCGSLLIAEASNAKSPSSGTGPSHGPVGCGKVAACGRAGPRSRMWRLKARVRLMARIGNMGAA